MAKAMLTRVPSFCGWNKHLRRYGKRLFWKSERKAAKRAAERDGCAGPQGRSEHIRSGDE